MTVSTSYAPLAFNGDGATTAFAVTWPFFAGTLVVTAIDGDGVETVKTITTHYTVSGGTDSDGLPATGTVTMLTAPASGTTLRITRSTPKTQAATWTNGGSFQAKTIESAFDKALLIAQEGGGGGGGAAYDGITGDVMSLDSSGAQDIWDAEDNPISNLPFAELTDGVAAPSTPASGFARLYAVDGSLYFLDDAGNEADVSGQAALAAASASAASASASSAASSASSASSSASAAAASYDSFDDRYLGSKAVAPSVDNDGDALIAGALYFDTATSAMYVYDGATWSMIALSWQGAWLTSTAYVAGQSVSNGGSGYVCTADHTSGASTEPGVGGSWAGYWDLLASKGDTGATGSTGSTGARGGIPYTFSTTTTMADPGSGVVRFNNATFGSITAIAVDDNNANAVDVSLFVTAWADSDSTHKGTLIVQSADGSDATVGVFTITGLTDNAGWTELAVTPVAGTVPSNSEQIVLTFSRTGQKGTAGVGSGDVTGPSASIDNEIALFSGTSGKIIKRATTTGLLKATSGVLAASTEITLSGNNVGVGPTTPECKLHVQDTSNYAPQIRNEHVGATAGSAGYWMMERARGTPGARTAVQSADTVGTIAARGHDGTSYVTGAYLQFRVDGTVATGIVPVSIDIMTMTAAGATASRLTIDADGYIGIGGVTSPTANLHAAGTVRFASIVSGLLKADASGNVSAEAAASASEVRAGTATKYVNIANTYSALDLVTLTDAATISVDMSTFLNATVTLAGNRTLGSPTNEKVGQSGVIYIVQDATGSRTLAYGSDWKFAGGTVPTLTTTASAVDALFYTVRATNFIYASLVKDVK